MISDEALGALLDQLARLDRREDQLAILRAWWIASLTQDRDEQRELLGKLGGG